MQPFLCITPFIAGLLVACSSPDDSAPLVSVQQQAEPEKVYTYVEQMPQLPGGGGTQAIVNALQKRIKIPHVKGEPNWGRIIVSFTVGPNGIIHDARIVQSSSVPAYDQATLNAVQALPRLEPGYHNGKSVAVSFAIPIAIHLQY
jgi:protein TonB